MRLLLVIEEDLEQYDEEEYEEPSCSTSGRFSRDDVDYLFLPYYDESIWYKYTSFGVEMFNGKNSKESF